MDNLDVSLQDDELLAEIDLTTSLMIVASWSDQHLTRAEIDQVLGIGDVAARPVASSQGGVPGGDPDRKTPQDAETVTPGVRSPGRADDR